MKKLFVVFIFILSIFTYAENIEVWTGWIGEEKDSLLGIASKYEVLTGNKVTVKIIPFKALNMRFKNYTLSGTGPDLVIGPSDWIGQFIVDDLLQPIDEYLQKGEKEEYIDTAINACYYKKKLYGLPESVKVVALVYNADMIEKAPITTKDMIEIGKKFTNEEEGVYGFANITSMYNNYCWIGGFGGELLDKEGNPKFYTPNVIKAYEFIFGLTKGKNKIMPQEDIGNDIVMELFKNKMVPMMLVGSWTIPELVESGINFKVAKIPIVSETAKRATPFTGSEIIMMSSKSKNKKTAYDFMKFFTSEDTQAENFKIGHIPSKKSVYDYRKVKQSKIYEYVISFKNLSNLSSLTGYVFVPSLDFQIAPFSG